MSGGHFDYKQNELGYIADSIERLIAKNEVRHDGYIPANYKSEIIDKFKETITTLRKASNMVQRVDWLVCGDDGEESFLERWKEEVGE